MIRMRGWGWVLIASAVTITAMLTVGHPLGAEPSAEKRVEYKVIEVLPDPRVMEDTLNRYGGAGWELAALGMGDLQAPRMILRRETGK